MVFLAAALLTAAALGAAIAIGSGRLSLPHDVDIPLIPSERVFEVALHYYDLTGVVVDVPEPTRVHARLPDGWTSTDSGITNDPADDEPALTVAFWGVDALFIDPCDPVGPHSADPPMMRSLDGLAGAFTSWWQGDASRLRAGDETQGRLPSSSDPVGTTVSGWRARYLEVRIPNTAAVAACDRYATWRNVGGVERRHEPGDVSRIWIVEVGPPRERGPVYILPSTPMLVIDAGSGGEPSLETLAELEEIIDSLRIEAPPAVPYAFSGCGGRSEEVERSSNARLCACTEPCTD